MLEKKNPQLTFCIEKANYLWYTIAGIGVLSLVLYFSNKMWMMWWVFYRQRTESEGKKQGVQRGDYPVWTLASGCLSLKQ